MNQDIANNQPNREARDKAMQLVSDAQDVRFTHAVDEAIKQTARELEYFTTEDVKKKCPITPENPMAYGPAMMRAAKKYNIIERTDRTRQSTEKTNHARQQTLWRSKIYRTPKETPRTSLFEDAAPETLYGIR